MTAREKALADAVEKFLAVDATEIGTDDDVARMVEYGTQVDAMREALAMPSEPIDVTLYIVEEGSPAIVVDAVDLVARMFGAVKIEHDVYRHGAWRFGDLYTARVATVAVVDLCTVARFTVPPLAVHYPTDGPL